MISPTIYRFHPIAHLNHLITTVAPSLLIIRLVEVVRVSVTPQKVKLLNQTSSDATFLSW